MDDGIENAAARTIAGDDDLAARARRGDAAALELVVRRHNPRLFRVARSIVADDAEAEDALQQAYLSAFEKIAGYEGRASLSTWLTRIVLHEALERVRRARTANDAIADYAAQRGEASDGDEPLQRAATGELRAALERALDTLPQPWRTVFVLRMVEGATIAETAETLEVSEETVKIRLHRARARLREILASAVDDESLLRSVHRFDGERCNRITAAVMARASSST
jgi:RNA polymerase sigma-70 factor (ECF subfamily)